MLDHGNAIVEMLMFFYSKYVSYGLLVLAVIMLTIYVDNEEPNEPYGTLSTILGTTAVAHAVLTWLMKKY